MKVKRRTITEQETQSSLSHNLASEYSGNLTSSLTKALKLREGIVYFTSTSKALDSFIGLLEHQGYNVRTLDFNNLLHSVSWNPFRYIYTKQDVMVMTNTLFSSKKKHVSATNDILAAKLLVAATISFPFDLLEYFEDSSRSQIIPNFNEDEINLIEFVAMLKNATKRNRSSNDYISKWQESFMALEMLVPRSFSVCLYNQYLRASAPLMITGIDIAMKVIEPIATPLAQSTFLKDETELDTVREKGNALVVVRPKWESNFLPLYVLAYKQILHMLTALEQEYNEKNPVSFVIGSGVRGGTLFTPKDKELLLQKNASIEYLH